MSMDERGHIGFRLEIILSLTPAYISSSPFPTLLRQHLPKQFVDEEVFGTYNAACTFIKHMNVTTKAPS